MKNEKKYLTFLLILSAKIFFAQHANFWAFKDYNGLNFMTEPFTNDFINFTTSNSVFNFNNKISSNYYGSLSEASVCDSKGYLLFYTDGINVWDKSNTIIDTGLTLNRDKNFYANTDYNAVVNPTSRNKIQVCCINDSLYYLFALFRKTYALNNNIDTINLKADIKFCIIQIINGAPVVTVHDSTIMNGSFINITHVKKAEGNYWLILRDSCLYSSIEITKTNITLKNSIAFSEPGVYRMGASSMIVSHNKASLFVGYSNHWAGFDSSEYGIYKYDFNISDGTITNQLSIEHLLSQTLNKQFYCLALSSNDKQLFIGNLTFNRNLLNYYFFITQKNLSDLNNIKTDTAFDHLINRAIEDFQEAYNGKLYFRCELGELGEISKPDSFPARKYIKFYSGILKYLVPLPVITPSKTAIFPGLDFEYHRIGFRKNDDDCKHTYLQNLCDTAFFKHYYWVVDNTDTFYSNDLQLNLVSKGAHFIKLRAFNKNEFGQWYSDSIYNLPSPVARFGFNTNEGCQYVAFTITDSSFADSINAQGCTYHYYFGDGKDTLIGSKKLLPGFKIDHTYLQSGLYTVRLIFDNGFCSDTFERINTVFIKPAPAPRFTVTTSRDCVPLTLRLKDTARTYVLEKTYLFNDVQLITTQNAQNFDTSFTVTDTLFKIKILLMGVTGCITTDSVTLHFKHGISATNTPVIIYTTVINPSQTLTVWNKVPNAISYTIVANGKERITTDTFYIDNTSTTLTNTYRLMVEDICGDISLSTPVSNPIVLTAENMNNNAYCLLTYTPYNYWDGGVLQYAIEKQDPGTKSFSAIAHATSTQLTYNDNSFVAAPAGENIPQTQTCYRISATNGIAVSSSNIACVDIKPTFFVPNAFSPNGDGTNDFFKPFGLGITSYTLAIYNRWGELLYTGTELDNGWTGAADAEGLYVYYISAGSKGGKTSSFNVKGTVMLVR